MGQFLLEGPQLHRGGLGLGLELLLKRRHVKLLRNVQRGNVDELISFVNSQNGKIFRRDVVQSGFSNTSLHISVKEELHTKPENCWC